MESLEVRDLTFTYPGGTKPALANISLAVGRGGFVTVCGPSGGGKTTLLRHLKPAMAPRGAKTGGVFLDGTPLEELPPERQAAAVGFVGQSPENQIVTDKVWHELAFGLECLGLETPVIRRRVAEMAAFFDIADWFRRDISTLSGGQKQLLNLASVMVMQPEILVLDEPTSRLDPVAASDFLAVIGRINRELGTAVVISEHRLEDVLPLSDRAVVMDGGAAVCCGAPGQVGETLRRKRPDIFLSMPAPMRIWSAVQNDLTCPVTAAQGAQWLRSFAADRPLVPVPERVPAEFPGGPAVRAKELWFRYEKDGPDVLAGFDLAVFPGEILALMGGNGVGKSTALSLLAGMEKPYRGSVKLRGRLAALPQEPLTFFAEDTVLEGLESALAGEDPADARRGGRIGEIAARCRLSGLLSRHPADLSGGEIQRAALARVLLAEPDILLLDEPTKGIDASFKRVFGQILTELAARGAAIIMVSHDAEFCARYAGRCALMFDGMIAAEEPPRRFFAGNYFYTTSASRMARTLLPEAVTPEDVIRACGGDAAEEKECDECSAGPEPPPPAELPPSGGLSPVRRALVWLFAAASVSFFVFVLRRTDFAALLKNGGVSLSGLSGGWAYAGLIASLACLSLAAGRGDEAPAAVCRRPGRATIVTAAVCAVLLPLTVLAGVYLFGDRKYLFISLLVLLEASVPFAADFEHRGARTRELVVTAVLCALAVAGRAAFFMLPGFKPVLAMVIISGAAFGGETGFVVGSLTMLVSNVMFGQGPWTPWQMFAMGLAGFAAGLIYGGGRLRPGRTSLCVFGALAAVFLYGPIVNLSSVLIWQPEVTWGMVLAAFAAGLPFDLVHAAATVIFLWLISGPMLKKLDRMKIKYGILE
jgi:energy-coupling factor transporter ATP-binding protein EcfA2/uncharacterized membrane protein